MQSAAPAQARTPARRRSARSTTAPTSTSSWTGCVRGCKARTPTCRTSVFRATMPARSLPICGPSRGLEAAAALRNQYRCSFNPTRAQVRQRRVGLTQRIGTRLRFDSNLRHKTEEFGRVAAREVSHRHDLTLFPKQAVWKGRDVAHVDAGADHAAAFAYGLERRGDE